MGPIVCLIFMLHGVKALENILGHNFLTRKEKKKIEGYE